jgi:hypothetical protein
VSRTIDGPASRNRAAVPKRPPRRRLRRSLLILFPVILPAFGTAYYLAEEPYVSTDDAFVRAAKDNRHVPQGELKANYRQQLAELRSASAFPSGHRREPNVSIR